MPKIRPAAAQYLQLADILRDRIARGQYLPGIALPSEPQLAAETGLSRVTVNRAVQVLRGEGLVQVVRGRGVFVASPADQRRPEPGTGGELTTDLLRTIAACIDERHQDALLVRNPVGNLAIVHDGEFVGWVDVAAGQLHWLSGS